MIEQGKDLWTPEDGRPRKWGAQSFGETVLLRHYLVVPEDGDYPKTLELTWGEWVASHATYGLTVEGVSL